MPPRKNQITVVANVPAITAPETVNVPMEMVVAPSPAVEFVVAPEYGDPTIGPVYIYPQPTIEDLGPLNNQPQPLVRAEGEYFVARPSRSVTKRDGNDLGRAVTLILQMLPLTDTANLLPEESEEIQQLLLRAAYLIETADATPMQKCKVNVA